MHLKRMNKAKAIQVLAGNLLITLTLKRDFDLIDQSMKKPIEASTINKTLLNNTTKVTKNFPCSY